jgi:hypothetical protein
MPMIRNMFQRSYKKENVVLIFIELDENTHYIFFELSFKIVHEDSF